MSASFFLDTNIFVYSFVHEPSKASRATRLIHEAIGTRKGTVSYQVVQEFFNVALRRFANPMAVADAEQYLATVFRPLLTVHSSQAIYGAALRLYGKYRLSWYDTLIVAAALEGQCQTLYSEDLQHGLKIDSLRIENPFL